MSAELNYFNFPIHLLDGFLIDTDNCLSNISAYGVYRTMISYGLEDLSDFIETSKEYRINFHNAKKTFELGSTIYNDSQGSPMAGINLKVYRDFYNNKRKSEFDKVCLLAFLAFKSIIGKKAYCKTVNLFWFSRIDGFACVVDSEENLSDNLRKYFKEYQIRKIKGALQDNNWGLVSYSKHTRGFYVSFKMDIDALVFEAEKRRATNKAKQRKQRENDAIEKALKRLSL